MEKVKQPFLTLFAEEPELQSHQDTDEKGLIAAGRTSGSEMTGGTRNTESDDVPYWD